VLWHPGLGGRDLICKARPTVSAGNLRDRFLRDSHQESVPLTPATTAALDAYLADRARRAGVGDGRQLAGPLLAITAGGRLRQGHLWELVRRLARTAGIEAWDQLSPHCLRHSAITFAPTPVPACVTCRITPGTGRDPAPPAATTMPGTGWTATPPKM